MTVPDIACPRCERRPVELATMGSSISEYIPACTCYPHPPLCPACSVPLEDDRCVNLAAVCPFFDLLIPSPDVDPLWQTIAGGR